MNILGLRIGNTNTSAFFTSKEHPDPQVVLVDGESCFPTAVALMPGGWWLAGRAALDRQISHPGAVIRGLTPLIEKQHTLPKQQIPVSPLTTLVRKVERHAEDMIGERVDYSFLSLPAHLDFYQKSTLITAVEAAGLKVKGTIPDSMATIIGADLVGTMQSVLVIRMGGTSTEVALLNHQSPWRIINLEGDLNLGGRDFDESLINWLTGRHPEFDREALPFIFQRQAEQAKKRLSAVERTQVGPIGLGEEN